ncbi:MAG: flippase-like domain-containing protein [Pirellulales bacterium]|nr:flippase-like domain-containing protein [Pirellulales bacterium]
MSPDRSRRKKWLMAMVKLLIVAAVLLAVRHTITKALADLGQYPWNFDPVWLLLAGLLYLLGLLPAGLFWHRVLHVLGQDARLGETLRAYYIGHLGKYVPGKAMVVVIRAGLIRSQRVNTAVAAISVFFETLTMMAAGAFIAAAILAAWFRDQTLLFWVAIGLMVAAGMPTLPPIFKRLVRLAGVGKSDPATEANLEKLDWRTLVIGWISMALLWVLLGWSLWAVLKAMGISDIHPIRQLHLYTAGVSLAMVAGFLSLVPGGAVVREAILAQLMVPHMGEVVALVSAVLLRLVWLLSELAASSVLWMWRPGGLQQRDRS